MSLDQILSKPLSKRTDAIQPNGRTVVDGGNLMTVSGQWATRPSDERFASLIDLYNVQNALREISTARVFSTKQIDIIAPDETDFSRLEILGKHRDFGGTITATPTHMSFGQLAQRARAPGGYLRQLPAPLSADCLNYGFLKSPAEEIGLLIAQPEGKPAILRAATGPNYGRVWNAEIAELLVREFGDGVSPGGFKVPGEFGKHVTVTKENTTIFGSDRDIYVFLCDEEHRLETANRRDGKPGSFARGMIVWNSEVGDKTLGAAFFLFDYACCNRIIWGVEGYEEMRLRHTAGAPDRWLGQIVPLLKRFANEPAAPIEARIKAAQEKKIGDTVDFLKKRQFSMASIRAAQEAHEREEGRPIESLFDVVTGLTAAAKAIPYQDERVEAERTAGALMNYAA